MRWMRGDAGSNLVVAPPTFGHRSNSGDTRARRPDVEHGGRSICSERKREKCAGRSAGSPGVRRRGRQGWGRSETAGINLAIVGVLRKGAANSGGTRAPQQAPVEEEEEGSTAER